MIDLASPPSTPIEWRFRRLSDGKIAITVAKTWFYARQKACIRLHTDINGLEHVYGKGNPYIAKPVQSMSQSSARKR